MTKKWIISFWLIACFISLSSVGNGLHAAEFPAQAIPDPLKSWVPWVLDEVPDAVCPQVQDKNNANQCVWPGVLDLKVNTKGAVFTQEFTTYRDTWIGLPGNSQQWPQDVILDGKPVAVIGREEVPVLKMPKGSHKISGRFAWNGVPESLQLPQNAALIKLELNGQNLGLPVRDESNQLWLQRKADADSAEQAQQVHVFRKVNDGVPITVETRIRLEVSGKGREIVIGNVLLPEMIALELQSPLPAVLKQDGSLAVQARAGSWDLRFVARHPGSVKSLTLGKAAGLTTDEEVWVFQAQALIRTAAIEGPSPVDPQQTSLPAEWRNLPAYLMHADSSFSFKEIRRGDSDPSPDKLSLKRRLWLGFDGNTLTMNDQIQGDISRATRLAMDGLAQLGRVGIDGQDQLITRGNDKLAGVEVKRGSLNLNADSLIDKPVRQISAVGWKLDFDKVSMELILPAGWRLLYASGVDRADGAWLSRWNLLDFFIVLVIALATGQLWGVKWGVLALFALTLSYQEPGAPRYAWLLLLALLAIVRVLPQGRFLIWVKRLQQVSLLALILMSLAFATAQVRSALYPVLEQDAYWSFNENLPLAPAINRAPEEPVAADAESVPPPPPPPPLLSPVPVTRAVESPILEEAKPLAKIAGGSSILSNARYKSAAGSRATNFQSLDPDAKVQTGPGLPGWQWRTYPLIFDGPVRQDQQLDLWLLPPWANKLLVLLRLLSLGLLLACVAGYAAKKTIHNDTENPGDQDGGRKTRRWRIFARNLTAMVLLALTSYASMHSNDAYAQLPTNEQLEELKQKLTRPADCLPVCAEVSRLMLQISGNTVRLGVDIDAAIDTALPLPGGVKYWLPHEARMDGKIAYVHRDDSGVLWLLAPAGRHRLELTGDLMQNDTLQLPLPRKPRYVDIHADAWDVAGLSEESGAADTLQLTRKIKAGSKTDAPLLPAFLQVERRLILDREWRVTTTVSRLSPMGTPALAEIPLLPGEAVTTAGMIVKDGKLLVNLGPQVQQVEWVSNLPQSPQISLVASQQNNWIESWIIVASGIWHVSATGLPPIFSNEGADLAFAPWPGETLKLSIERPQAIPGQTLTIDLSRLTVSPGTRASDYHLKLRLRSSRGGDHALILPEGAVLQSVSINQQVRPIRANGRRLVLPVVPGTQEVDVNWRLDQGMTSSYTTAAVNLQVPSVNNWLDLKMPHDRWLLMASGPGLGPAILFWGKLIVLLAVALLLGRYSGLAVHTSQWLLLALGLTQVEWWGAALVVAWFYAFARRARSENSSPRWLFNLRQLGLFALTLALLGVLLSAVEGGLLGRPDMQVTGNNSSYENLLWYVDRAGAELHNAWVFSLPILVYRGLMLLWALWLAWSLLAWLKWGWQAFASDGLWRQKQSAPKVEASAPEVGVSAGNVKT
ncbi:hypothetical protein [Undibacterium sp. TJN19]|uniref:hypothetical protein n=1 Tax=Undibacterium sp. TJN19 TaxID=3413055 RepID=UPI003BF3AB91